MLLGSAGGQVPVGQASHSQPATVQPHVVGQAPPVYEHDCPFAQAWYCAGMLGGQLALPELPLLDPELVPPEPPLLDPELVPPEPLPAPELLPLAEPELPVEPELEPPPSRPELDPPASGTVDAVEPPQAAMIVKAPPQAPMEATRKRARVLGREVIAAKWPTPPKSGAAFSEPGLIDSAIPSTSIGVSNACSTSEFAPRARNPPTSHPRAPPAAMRPSPVGDERRDRILLGELDAVPLHDGVRPRSLFAKEVAGNPSSTSRHFSAEAHRGFGPTTQSNFRGNPPPFPVDDPVKFTRKPVAVYRPRAQRIADAERGLQDRLARTPTLATLTGEPTQKIALASHGERSPTTIGKRHEPETEPQGNAQRA